MPELSDDSIFISYSRRDTEIMQKIVLLLREQGFKVWVDNEKLIPGTPIWEEEIEKAIKSCGTVLVIMSPDSKNSEWVRREITLADQYRKHIMPVLVRGDEDSSISLRLVTRQFVDLRQDEDTGLKSLHGALSRSNLENKGQPIKTSGEENIRQRVPDFSVQPRKEIHPSVDQRETSKWKTIFWITLGWMIAGGIGGFAFSSIEIGVFDDIGNEIFGGLVGGFVGGLVMMVTLQSMKSGTHQKNLLPLLTGWTLGGGIGWLIGFELTEAIGAGIGIVIFVIIGLAGTYGFNFVVSNLRSVAGISAAWFVGETIGWLIARRWMIDSLGMDHATSWAIGTALAWAVGGFVLGWQVLNVRE